MRKSRLMEDVQAIVNPLAMLGLKMHFRDHQQSVLLGDINLDGVVDLLDVSPFVDLLTSGMYQAEGDINQDGFVDLLDVGPFVDILTGG